MTPLQYNVFASKMLGTNLYLKRDDLFPISGGGSKGRKIDYILSKCLEDKCNAVVTCGGIQSNHTRATAIRCKELGLECSIIIHSEPVITSTGNLKILEMLGVNIIYCEMKDVAVVMDNEMERLNHAGFSPFYIWGGGHCYEGTLAFYDAVEEVSKQTDIEFDYVFLASGTGTTQAGLHCGFKHLYKNTTVFGISIARESEKGALEVKKSISEFVDIKKLDSNYTDDIQFTDKYNFGGYEKRNNDLTDCVDRVAKESGIILDHTYTGKAWYGMEQFIKENKDNIASKNILFWHTGGLLNLMG